MRSNPESNVTDKCLSTWNKWVLTIGVMFFSTSVFAQDSAHVPLSIRSLTSNNSNALLVIEPTKFDGCQVTDSSEAGELGQHILAIQQVIANPKQAEALSIVTTLGHDQRYYTLVRGWLIMQLAGDTSILSVNPNNEDIAFRVNFLKEAIKAIDLE